MNFTRLHITLGSKPLVQAFNSHHDKHSPVMKVSVDVVLVAGVGELDRCGDRTDESPEIVIEPDHYVDVELRETTMRGDDQRKRQTEVAEIIPDVDQGADATIGLEQV